MALFDLTANTNARKVPILNVEYPKDVTMMATDGNATFTAVIAKDGRPDKYTYQWYVNGAPVAGATNATYVRNVSGDKGQYTVYCDVTNKAGTVRTRNAILTVKKLTTLDARYPADSSLYVGSVATFSIATTEHGYPASFTCQWYVNGVAVPGATGTSFNHYRSLEGTDTVYCMVTNEAGSVKSRTATLTAQRIYLYNYGDTCDKNSGGWVEARTSSSLNATFPSSMLRFMQDFISIQAKRNTYDGGCGTAIPFDLTKQTRLNAIAYTNDQSSRSVMCVCSNLHGIDTNSMAATVLPTVPQTISLDISNVGSCYVAFSAHGGDADCATVIHAVWLG